MAYQMHNPTEGHPGYSSEIHTHLDEGPGYASRAFFEEEDLKYGSAGYEKDDPFSADYRKMDETKEEEMTEFEKQIEEENKSKYEKGDKEEEIVKRKAAEEVHKEDISGEKKMKKKGVNEASSIEDAIEKAIKEEKKIIYIE